MYKENDLHIQYPQLSVYPSWLFEQADQLVLDHLENYYRYSYRLF